MKINARILVALAAGGLFAAGCASTGRLAKEEAAYPKDKVDARGLYLESCARCHGKDGRAKTFHGWLAGAQNFTDPQWKMDTSDVEIMHAIRVGHESMPAFGEKLSPAEIEALAAYVQTFKSAE